MAATKLRSFDEALKCMKHSMRVYIRSQVFFVYAKEKIACFNNGSRYYLSIEDFHELYEDEDFFILEEGGEEIDLTKDEDYYRFYHK